MNFCQPFNFWWVMIRILNVNKNRQSFWVSCTSTVKDNPQLSDLKGSRTSKLDWRYFEHNKDDRNELLVRKSLHKGTRTKMTNKLNKLTEKNESFLFLCLYPNRCEPGVNSYQLYNVQSTSSPILKFLVLWGYFG